MKKLSLLLILLPALLSGQTITATYEDGDIPTSQLFYSAVCNGPLTTLELELPAGSLWQVTGVDVSYSMTAQNGGLKSHQRSMIYCENTATGESTAAQGVGATGGMQAYNRSGLNIANGIYPGNTMLVFQMRAWRAEPHNAGCNTTYNRVNNFSWTITVHYEEVPDDGSAGIGTMSPDASAILELQSMQKGFLPPRMTTSLREAIPNPATGLMVYDTDLGSLQVFDGAAWSSIVVGSDMQWVTSGSDIYYEEGNVGIGASEPAALLHTSGTGQGEGNLLFEGEYKDSEPGDPPAEGAGTRMMWYPDKAAFRVGRVLGTQWDKNNIGNFSVAMGQGTTASGSYSTAMGRYTTASGSYSTAMGRNTTASGAESMAMGWQTTASGLNSTAIGRFTTASGNYSTAMGWLANASGGLSTAMGLETTASGSGSTAMGSHTTASGWYSTAMGVRTTAPSFVETVVGRWNTIYTPNNIENWDENDRLFVIGNGTAEDARSNAMTVLKNGSIGIGTSSPNMNYKMDIAGGDVLIHGITVGRGNSSIVTNTAVGNAALSQNTTGNNNTAIGFNTLSIVSNGSYNTAIGRNALALNTNSNYNTAVGYNAGFFEHADLMNSHNNTFLGANTSHIPTADINNSTAVGANVYLAQSNTVILGNNASVGINTNQPTQRLDVDGNARIRNITWGPWAGSLHYTSDGTLTKSTSDERMKTNIKPLGNSLSKVLQLQGVSFTWIDDPGLGTRLGMIAQDVEKILPELVFTDENDGYKGINYAEITAVLVEAIKEQQQIIEWLMEKVKANESEY